MAGCELDTVWLTRETRKGKRGLEDGHDVTGFPFPLMQLATAIFGVPRLVALLAFLPTLLGLKLHYHSSHHHCHILGCHSCHAVFVFKVLLGWVMMGGWIVGKATKRT